MFWNYNLGEWLREDEETRALAIADYQEHCYREGFEADRRERAREAAAGSKPDYFRVRQGGGERWQRPM